MTIYGHEIFEGIPKATRQDTCVRSGSLTVKCDTNKNKLKYKYDIAPCIV